MNKKPLLIFTCADQANFPYAVMMLNSLCKFHSPKDVDILLITNETDPEKLKLLPEGVILEDLNLYTKDDPIFFYRQKPIVMDKYLDTYDLVLGMDADQIVLDDLSYIWKTLDYDVATVINWNRIDPQNFGFVEINRLGIAPPEYFNCGLVACRSKKFAHQWLVDCFTEQFNRSQYKEQDILNVLCYFGNFNVRCLDHGDKPAKMMAWWGLISKGEYGRAVLKDGKIVIPKGLGDTPFPGEDMTLKVIHAGGGSMPNKMNYRTWFSEDIIQRLDELTK